jgi:CBS domain-containing protein
MQVADVVAFFTADDAPARHKSYPVVDVDGKLLAMVSRADALARTRSGWPAGQTLGEQLADREPVVGYEDELVGRLADRMAAQDVGRVPILGRADGRVVGLAARRDLLRVRAQAVQHEREREVLIRLRPARAKAR